MPTRLFADLHGWWEVPCIGYFCCLFKTTFRLFEFAIEELELGLIADGTSKDNYLVRDLIICLLRGCYQTDDVTFINWESYLYDILQKLWVKEKRSNPLSCLPFCVLPLRTKVEILYSLCECRLDIVDVANVMKAVDAKRLRVQPLGRDQHGNVYWYFNGFRLYREECLIAPENLKKKWDEEWKKECEKYFQTNNTTKITKRRRGRPKKVLSDSIHLESDGEEKNKSKKTGNLQRPPRWTVVCNTLEDWFKLAEKFRKSKSVWERKLYKVLSGGFLDSLTALAAEKEKNASLGILENLNQHNESIRQELQNGGVENQLTNLSHKQRQKKHKEISVDQQGDRKETRASKAKAHQVKHQEEKEDSASADSVITRQAEKLLDNEEKSVPSCSQELQQKLHRVLTVVKNHKDSWPFLEPVDESFAPGYYSIIKNPIDLSVIEKKIHQGAYSNWKEMQSDFRKMIQNCNLYNGSHSDYAIMAQTIWRQFQKQIKKIFIDAPSNHTSKKKVRFLLPVNVNDDESSSTAGRDCSLDKKEHKATALKTDNKRNRRRKKRPPGMRAIEMLAEAAEKALKAEESNLKNSSSSNEEVSLTSVSTAFPSLKVSTTQCHPASLIAKCLGTSEINTNEPALENTKAPNFTKGSNATGNLSKGQECSSAVVEDQDAQFIDKVSNPSDSAIEFSGVPLTSQHVTVTTMEGDHSLSSNNNNSRNEKSHSPLILYLSSENDSYAAKGKDNNTHHNYALAERSELAMQTHEETNVQNIENFEKSQAFDPVVPHVSPLVPTTGSETTSESGYLKEAPENCFPPESLLKSALFTASQERTEMQQPIDASILNSSPLFEMADQAVKLVNEEQVHSEVSTNENSLPDNGLQPSLPQQYLHPVNQFSSNIKSLQNETPLSGSLPSFNQFLSNGQYSLSEHGISTVPPQMMLTHFPNHLMPHSNFPNIEGRNVPSTIEQIIPSQQYICHPASTLTASSPYQTLSMVHNSKDQGLHPFTSSTNLVLLPTSSSQPVYSNESSVPSNREAPQAPKQATVQQGKLSPAATSHMINATGQNYLTSGCIFPGSSYPALTAAESGIGFTGRSLGIPVMPSPSKEWNMMCNNYNPITASTSIQSHIHSHPTALKQPPIILQKPCIASKKSISSHSPKIINGKQSNESAVNGVNQTSLLGTASVPTSKATYQPVQERKAIEERIDLVIPSSLSFQYPSSTQANSQYLLENLEPTVAANVPGSTAQLFPYPGEKLFATQNINAFYPSHLIGSVRMSPSMNGHAGPIITPGRNHQGGIPPILVPSGQQIGNVDSLKSTKLMSMQLPSVM